GALSPGPPAVRSNPLCKERMMSRSLRAALGALGLVSLLTVPAGAGAPREAARNVAAEKAARDSLARFDKGDPGGRVRVEALVGLAKQGPATVPVLVEVLRKGSPSAREFAAQALVFFAEPALRPALEQALDDPKSGVRIHAIQALSMLGRLEATER